MVMSEQSDRTWLLPKFPWVMRMTWSELLFAHWQVEPSCIAALLPPHLELDTRDGKAWIGIVPFLMSNIAPRWCPPLPRLSRFLELNVRTYVKLDGKPGVWFFSLDAENPVAVRVARATFNLPYMDATMAMTKRDAATITYQSNRTHRGEALAALDVCYESCGTPFQAIPGTLEHWLTARYCLYSANRKGRLFRGEIDHPPWTLTNANWKVKKNSMCSGLGVDLIGQPHLLYAQPITVRAWPATRC
ncbi:MAG: YqjF family protein [Planctomycetota bacterium]